MSIWDDVALHQERTRCRCELRAGMTHAELNALGGGCKMPSYGCPALTKYRRMLPKVSVDEQDTGWSPEHSQVRRAND